MFRFGSQRLADLFSKCSIFNLENNGLLELWYTVLFNYTSTAQRLPYYNLPACCLANVYAARRWLERIGSNWPSFTVGYHFGFVILVQICTSGCTLLVIFISLVCNAK